jgi:GntR family uxuAB operon transcriptional repressor
MMTVDQSLRALLTRGAHDGTLGPGAKLPTERELVQRLDAPRSAIRRALDALEREGVVIRHVGRGTFLTEAAMAHVDGAPANTSPAEIMQVRQLLEPQVAILAARVATQADLDRIAECLAGGGASEDFESFERWDAKLHRAIATAAHNGLLMNMFDVMNTARALPVWGSLKRRTSTPELRRCYHGEHTAIVEALCDRDPLGAGESMRAHLQHVSDSLLGRH